MELDQEDPSPNVFHFICENFIKSNYIGAARALLDIEGLDAETIARKAMKIASDKCIYTSDQFIMEKVVWE